MHKSSVLERIAHKYNQLYITPEAGISETGMYYDVVNCGIISPEFAEIMAQGLTGFSCSENDSYYTEITPAGEIDILYLSERSDFERFLQIMVYRGEPVSIDSDIDIAEINGIINWRKIEKHMDDYYFAGGELSTLRDEMDRFRKNKADYQDNIVIATNCCYCGLNASEAGFEEEIWDKLSINMNIYNSCSRIIMRKMFPDIKNIFLEELYSDCTGMLFAIDEFDPELEKKLLDISFGIPGERFRFSAFCCENHSDISQMIRSLDEAVGIIDNKVRELRKKGINDYYQILIELVSVSRNILEQSGLSEFC